MDNLKFAFFSHLDRNIYRFRLPLLKLLVKRGARVYVISPEGEISQKFSQHGVEFIPFQIDRSTFNPFTAGKTIKKLSDLLKNLQPDVLHAFTLRPNAYGALAGKKAQVPTTIGTVTGLGSLYTSEVNHKTKLLRKGVNLFTRFALKDASAIIFQNPDDRQYYLNRELCDRGQAKLIVSSGVNLEKFSKSNLSQPVVNNIVSDWNIPSNRPVVTMIARLIIPKGVQQFLQAAKNLKERAVFILIGDVDSDNPHALPHKELNKYSQEKSIILTGRQQNIPEWLAISDIYTLPSYYREGVPRTILEAMAMELPIITTDHPGCRETVVEGKNGLLIPPKNVESLTNSLEELISCPEERERMGRYSRKLAENQFSSEKIIQEYVELYEELLSQKGSS